MGAPIRDALNTLPPNRLQERVVYAQPDKVATFRLTGDKKRAEASRWFKATRHPIRSGNEVKYLVDGADTFSEMAYAIRTATKKEHFVYMLGWTMFIDCPLLPGTTLGQLFEEASNKGAQVRAMVWQGWGMVVKPPETPWGIMPIGTPIGVPGMPGGMVPMNVQASSPINSAAVDFINKLANGQAILDSRHLNYGSHHQKILVVNGDEGLIAFVGGVDVNPDRIFAMGVNGALQAGGPMHDVHCRLRGPITKDLLQTFVDRWSDYVAAMHVKERAPLTGLNAATPPAKGTLQVQLARTFGNTTAHGGATPPYAFAPTGETTIMEMCLQAIGAAKRFIYIEDQYLVAPEASAALLKALGTIQQLVILIPHSSISDLPHAWELRKKFIDPLMRLHANKVGVYVRSPYGPLVPHSYVHAKTWIFDDQFAIIGSANCNLRGWTHDSESCVGVYDESSDRGATYTFAHRLRIRLWAEHLGMDTPEGHALLADGPGNAWRWSRSGSLARYDPDSGKDSVTSGNTPMSAADPDGR